MTGAWNFIKIKDMAEDLGLTVVREDESRGVFAASDQANGIMNMMFDCSGEVLIMEQAVMPAPDHDRAAFFEKVLQINRQVLFGAFVLDSQSRVAMFRATHPFEKITKQMIESSLRGLEQAMTQFGPELASFLGG